MARSRRTNIRSRFERLRNFIQQKPGLDKRKEIQSGLAAESTVDVSYLVLTLGSCAIATLGLLSNSAAVIIGAMILAPLMSPIRGLAFGALAGNTIIFRRAAGAIATGTFLSIALACLIGYLVDLSEFGSEVLSRSAPTLLDLGIAICAGAIAGFAKIEPKVSSSLAGTAIAVALMPPLCIIGLGLSKADWSLSSGATLLYLTNLLGITLSCMVVFLITGCASLRRGGRALGWTAVFTSLLIFPLGASFIKLARQAELEALLREVIVDRTVTFQRARLVSSTINWNTQPPEAYLTVTAVDTVTPKQIGLLEDFVQVETGRRFILLLQVTRIENLSSSGEQSLVAPAGE